MRFIFIVSATILLVSCVTYSGSEMWRRSTCNSIIDADERAQCLETATRSEKEYKQDVKEATKN